MHIDTVSSKKKSMDGMWERHTTIPAHMVGMPFVSSHPWPSSKSLLLVHFCMELILH